MKMSKFYRHACLICLLALVVSCLGCETARGLGRDIKNADQWIRDHAW